MELDLIIQLIRAHQLKDNNLFRKTVYKIINEEEIKNQPLMSKKLKDTLREGSPRSFVKSANNLSIPCDNEKGFPLIEIKYPTLNWDDVVLKEDTMNSLLNISKEIKNSSSFSSYKLKPINKILFYGPPGTGKTLSAKILSSEIGYPLAIIKFESVISSLLGETAANLRKIFDFIDNGKWIVLFDEFDVIGKKRDDPTEHGEIKRVVNNFMLMLDNYEGDSILIASTNHHQLLDVGIWRRFNEIINFELPDEKCREMIFSKNFSIMKIDRKINMLSLAKKTNGYSGSDIEQSAIRSMKYALLENRNIISKNDIEKSIQRQSDIISVRIESE